MEMTNSASKSLTFEEIIADPSLERYHKAAQFFKENKIIFPDKFMASLKSIVNRDLQNLYAENPQLPLSKVVALMLEGMNENMSAEMIKDITTFILDRWGNKASFKDITKQNLTEII